MEIAFAFGFAARISRRLRQYRGPEVPASGPTVEGVALPSCPLIGAGFTCPPISDPPNGSIEGATSIRAVRLSGVSRPDRMEIAFALGVAHRVPQGRRQYRDPRRCRFWVYLDQRSSLVLLRASSFVHN